MIRSTPNEPRVRAKTTGEFSSIGSDVPPKNFEILESRCDERKPSPCRFRIADFSRVVAGPYSTYLLARMGAEVVKVEGISPMDHTREVGPYTDATQDRNRSGYFSSVNAAKKSVSLQLSDPALVAIAREIAERSDVVVEELPFRRYGAIRAWVREPVCRQPEAGNGLVAVSGALDPWRLTALT